MTSSTSYLIVEKKSSEISFIWKTVHVSLYLTSAIVSMILSNSMGNIWSEFDTNCILNSNLQFKPLNNTNSNETSCLIDNVQTKWSKNYSDCNSHFMIYLLLCCASVIMLTYFIFLNVGSHAPNSQMTSSWRIIWVAILVNSIAFVAAIVDARSIIKSVYALCHSFPDSTKLTKNFPCTTECLCYNDKDKSYLSASLNFLALLPWFSVFLWGLSLAWCIIRILCHPDFSMYQVMDEKEFREMERSTSDEQSTTSTTVELKMEPSTSKGN